MMERTKPAKYYGTKVLSTIPPYKWDMSDPSGNQGTSTKTKTNILLLMNKLPLYISKEISIYLHVALNIYFLPDTSINLHGVC